MFSDIHPMFFCRVEQTVDAIQIFISQGQIDLHTWIESTKLPEASATVMNPAHP